MSRKFDRQRRIQQEVNGIITDPAFMRQIFKTKPRWMPRFVWRFLVGLVIRK